MAGNNVSVANTFIHQWEIQSYLTMAEEIGVRVQIITAEGEWGNIHNVPDSVDTMRSNWEAL